MLGSSLEIQWFPYFSIAGRVSSAYAILLAGIVELILLVLGLKLAVEALLNTANDRGGEGKPGASWAGDGHAAVQFFLLLIFFAPSYLLAMWLGSDAGWLALLFVSLVLPAAIILAAMDESLLHALDPRAWWALVSRIGAVYFALVLKLALIALLASGLCLLIHAGLPGWLAAVTSRFVVLYAAVLGYHLMGEALLRQHEQLGMDIAAPIKRPALANLEEDALMQQADNLAAEGNSKAAAELLQALIHRSGASAPIHARYRQLLRELGDQDRLSRHGRDYVPVLLALGQARQALALHDESRALDPGFQLPVPEDVTRLFEHAVATGQSQKAIELATGFEQRFPRNADVPRNMLTVAKLMADRFGRDAEASQLLEGLAERYPEHPLAADIQSALAALNRGRNLHQS